MKVSGVDPRKVSTPFILEAGLINTRLTTDNTRRRRGQDSFVAIFASKLSPNGNVLKSQKYSTQIFDF